MVTLHFHSKNLGFWPWGWCIIVGSWDSWLVVAIVERIGEFR